MNRGFQKVEPRMSELMQQIRCGLALLHGGQSRFTKKLWIAQAAPVWFSRLEDFVTVRDWDKSLIFWGWRVQMIGMRFDQAFELSRLSQNSEELTFYGLTTGPLVAKTSSALQGSGRTAVVRIPSLAKTFVAVARENRIQFLVPVGVEEQAHAEEASPLQVRSSLLKCAMRALGEQTEQTGETDWGKWS